MTTGSVNPREVRAMVDDAGRRLVGEQGWLDDRRSRLAAAREALDREIGRRLETS